MPLNPIHVSVVGGLRVHSGIRVHRRQAVGITTHQLAPTTTPTQTLIDVSSQWPRQRLEAAVNEALKRGVIRPQRLLDAAERAGHVAAHLRDLLARQAFKATDSELERRFLRLVRQAALPEPLTQVRIGRFRVDFLWPEHGLVVETDGGRFHHTASQQTRDRQREHALMRRGVKVVRFTHGQVFFEPDETQATLAHALLR